MDAVSADAIRIFIEKMADSFVSPHAPQEDLEGLHALVMDSIETRLIQTVIKKCQGNKARASKVLGLHRNTLAQKLESASAKPPLRLGRLRRGLRQHNV